MERLLARFCEEQQRGCLVLSLLLLLALPAEAQYARLNNPPPANLDFSSQISPQMGITTAELFHDVSYETDMSNLSIGVTLTGSSAAWAHVFLEIGFVSFEDVTPLHMSYSPGSNHGAKTFSSSDGPKLLLVGIQSVRATARMRVRLQLENAYVPAGPRQYHITYTIY